MANDAPRAWEPVPESEAVPRPAWTQNPERTFAALLVVDDLVKKTTSHAENFSGVFRSPETLSAASRSLGKQQLFQLVDVLHARHNLLLIQHELVKAAVERVVLALGLSSTQKQRLKALEQLAHELGASSPTGDQLACERWCIYVDARQSRAGSRIHNPRNGRKVRILQDNPDELNACEIVAYLFETVGDSRSQRAINAAQAINRGRRLLRELCTGFEAHPQLGAASLDFPGPDKRKFELID